MGSLGGSTGFSWGGYLPNLSINYDAMSKDMEKRFPRLYYIKMKISYDLGFIAIRVTTVSYTHLRAHETKANLVCRLLLEKKADYFTLTTSSEKNSSVRWLDWIFWGCFLSSLSINYVGISKDMEKRLPQLHYIKMKISYDLGFIAIGVAMAT